MRDSLGIDKSIDILDYVHSLPETEQEEAQEKLRTIERSAMVDMEAQPGLEELMKFLTAKNIPKTICTRNFPVPVQHLLNTFLPQFTFEPLITREFKPPKPSPHGILHIAEKWGIDPSNLIMVGDSIDDMVAGHSAGAATILLESDVNSHLKQVKETDITVTRLDEIVTLLEEGFEAKPE